MAEYEDNTLNKKYLWGEDVSGSMAGAGGVGALLVMNDTTEDYYSMYDGNGNIVKYVDETSNEVASFEYTPFGAIKSASGSMVDELHYRFSTKYFDNNTNLIVYRYRNYNPQTGKWQTRDPIGENGGRNVYGFIVNDSINKIDLLELKIFVVLRLLTLATTTLAKYVHLVTGGGVAYYRDNTWHCTLVVSCSTSRDFEKSGNLVDVKDINPTSTWDF
ncbi:RHS repeat-associated core domain-containing protein [Lentisphaerota bacterium WC36G]|nr:RHS repeat-associated core domain-containing protein [Lentisphaerae bacterium WC36]